MTSELIGVNSVGLPQSEVVRCLSLY